jgi:steroid delta-isomerase-like uncharacterized protein
MEAVAQKHGRFVMRRFVVSLSVVVVLLGLATSWHAQVAAQEATPATDMTLPPLIAEWFETTIAGDGQAFAALYTPQGVHEDIPANTVARGPDELAAYVDEFTTQQEDIQVQVRAVHRTDDGAVVEYTGMSTDVASGQRVTVPVVTIFEMEGDHIRRSADYYDVAGILGQLGVLDMGEATPAP